MRDDKTLPLLERWWKEKSPLWLSSKLASWCLAVECTISDFSTESLTLKFDGFAVGAQLTGTLTVPLKFMMREYFESATEIDFNPPASFDGPMQSCVKITYQGHNDFILCELSQSMSPAINPQS